MIGTIPVTTVHENGLFGLQLSPDFATTGHIYVAYATLPDAAATYALPSGTKITAGAEYAWLGDADVVSGGGSAEFTDNSTIGLAMKIAVPF